MSQVTEQSVRFQTALASIKLIQASAVLDLTEDDFDFLTSNKVWIATDRSRARRCVEACVYGKIGRAVQQECRNRYRLPSAACKKTVLEETMLLAEKVAVLYGASGNLGRAVARAFARDG